MAKRRRNYCGHYEQAGTIWTEHNLEFTQMLYGGMMGSPIISDIMQPIDQEKAESERADQTVLVEEIERDTRLLADDNLTQLDVQGMETENTSTQQQQHQ